MIRALHLLLRAHVDNHPTRLICLHDETRQDSSIEPLPGRAALCCRGGATERFTLIRQADAVREFQWLEFINVLR